MNKLNKEEYELEVSLENLRHEHKMAQLNEQKENEMEIQRINHAEVRKQEERHFMNEKELISYKNECIRGAR